MVLEIGALLSRLTSLQMAASRLLLEVEILLLWSEVSFICPISHTQKKAPAHVNSDASTWDSLFCSAFLRQDISPTSLFYMRSAQEIFEASVP